MASITLGDLCLKDAMFRHCQLFCILFYIGGSWWGWQSEPLQMANRKARYFFTGENGG